jgi:hypothetical protein
MSIEAKLIAHMNAGRLKKYEPPFPVPGMVYKRPIYMLDDVYQDCRLARRKRSSIKSHTLTEAHSQLTAIAKGDEVDEDDIKGLNGFRATGVWEIRVLMRPQARLFCYFAEKNVIIITNHDLRGDLEKGGQAAWDSAFEKLNERQSRLLQDIPIMIGRSREDHITDEFQ